jgi:hypothetical protein
MAEQTNTAPEKVEANWDALSSDPVMGDPTFQPAAEPKKEDIVNQDVIDKPEPDKPAEDKPVVDDKAKAEADEKLKLAEEAKSLNLPETATKEEIEAAKLAAESPIELKVEDIADVPKKHPEGSYKALAQQLGFEIEEDSIDAIKSKVIPVEEAEKKAKVSKEEFFSTLNPEVAAALEFKEMGLPDNLLLEPTKEIDGWLKLDDAELVRANLAATDGWTTEMIDTEIESLVESGKITHEAAKLRIGLNNDKNVLLAQRKELVQKYTTQKQESLVRQKEQEKTQFIEAMNKVSSLMGVPIPKEVKEALIIKYNNGVYDKDFASLTEAKVNYVLNKELGNKLAAHIRNKASEQVKKAATDELLNIPPVQSGGGGKAEIKQEADNWSAVEQDFK